MDKSLASSREKHRPNRLASDLIYQGWREEVKELVALLNKPLLKSLLSVHDAVAQRDFEPTLPPIPDGVLEEEEDSVKIVSLVKTKEPLLFVRALFHYDPNEDPAVPCKNAAVAFNRGDILQIVSTEDDTWWQACHVRDDASQAGLIPSQQLHERRVALQRPKALFKPRVKPPGPSGVGVNELKRRLLISNPDHYGVTVPHTTREKRRQENEGVDYHFVSVHTFEGGILNHRFIEYGMYKGHYYGTSLDSVHQVMAEGKVCLLDVHPSKIKHVYTSEFRPYVVFVKPPQIEELRLTRRRAKFICDEDDTNLVRIFSEEDFEDMIDLAETMENQYGHLFDKVIVNGDIAVVFRELKADLEKIAEADIQWIPAEWSCSSPTKARRSCGYLTGWI
ncbi:MAGUK p55 subfamily member 7 [Channa argus]|uniref:MAGUK p55 subfamily member 7 n=1 Tax=Channa argus TaxID=215402 RepID=A0A6G1Q8Q0_CHAAH|nr:MAGUK p55 subfamily member 7 [Channa argus]